MPELPQQSFRHDAGFMLRRNRSGQLTAPPPQAGRIALDQFQHLRRGAAGGERAVDVEVVDVTRRRDRRFQMHLEMRA